MVREYVQTNTLAVSKTGEAANFSNFRFSTDFSYGPDTDLSHLSQLKMLARIFALQAALAAEEGRSEEWSDKIVQILKLASAIDEEPAIIPHLVRNAIVRMAIQTTERGLNRVSPGDAACQKLQKAFIHAGETNLLTRALVGERANMIPVFRLSLSEVRHVTQSDEGDGQPRKPQHYSGKPIFILWLSGFFERDLNFYLQTMDKGISLSKLTFPESLVLTNQFDEASQIAQKEHYLLSGMLLPPLLRVATREAALETQIRLVETAMAVEQFRNVRGQLPPSLKELVPQFLKSVPADPFTAEPLRYRLSDKGYVIYGVDSDGRDNGGCEGPDHKKMSDTNCYDITFTVMR